MVKARRCLRIFATCVLALFLSMAFLNIDSSSIKAVTATIQVGDNVEATLDADGTLTLSGTGDTFDYSTSKLSPLNEYSSYIKSIVVEDGVSDIGSYLFFNCGNVNGELDLGNSVVEIKDGAFYGENYQSAPKFSNVKCSFTNKDITTTDGNGNTTVKHLEEQIIGSYVFFTNQSGTYEVNNSNTSLINALKNAGYVDKKDQKNSDSETEIMTMSDEEVTPQSEEHDIWDGTNDTSWYNDTDTTFTITTPEQLGGFERLVDSGKTFAGKTVFLGNDLYMNDVSNFDDWSTTAPERKWAIIGTSNAARMFAGKFNGLGHSIDGIYVSANTYQGFFSVLKGGEVCNLNMTHEYVNAAGGTAGGICYQMQDGASIHDCSVNGLIKAYANVGGITMVVLDADSEIYNCVNNATVRTTSNANAGGIACKNFGSIVNCYNTGNVSTAISFAGGIVAVTDGSKGNGLISNCYCSVDLVGKSNTIGAIAGGITSNAPISNCYNIYTSSKEFVGTNYALDTVTDCYNFDNNLSLDNANNSNLTDALNDWVTNHDIKYKNWIVESGDYIYPVLGELLPYDTSWYADDQIQGTGSQDNPYIILDKYDYFGLCKIINGEMPFVTDKERAKNGDSSIAQDSFNNKYIKVGSGITFNENLLNDDGSLNSTSSIQETPMIGTDTIDFAGSFDGSGYIIEGVYINETSKTNVGLFTSCTGDIKNIILGEGYISGTQATSATGGIVGWNKTTSKIYTCENRGTIVVGGTNGTNTMGTGGISGMNHGIIDNCINEASISGGYCVSGISGINNSDVKYAANPNAIITNCANKGDVSGTAYIGGITSRNWLGADVMNSYNTGSITSQGNTYVGGIVANNVGNGLNDGTNARVINCYNAGSVNGGYSAGIDAWAANGVIENTYNIGSISSNYAISRSTANSIKNNYNYYLKDATQVAALSEIYLKNYGYFSDNDGALTMEQGTTPEGESDLLSALNSYVDDSSEKSFLKNWYVDPNQNNGYPILGEGKLQYDTSWYWNDGIQGTGTKDNPYVLLDKYDFAGFAEIVSGNDPIKTNSDLTQHNTDKLNQDSFNNKYIELGDNIIFNENLLKDDGTVNLAQFIENQVVGGDSYEFEGNFDGKNNSLSGIYIPKSKNNSSGLGALFSVNTGSIHDVTINDSYVEATSQSALLCANNEGTIDNVITNGVIINKTNGHSGGLCCLNSGTISNSTNNATITGCKYVGGICTGNSGKLENVINAGDLIISKVAAKAYVGGLCSSTSSQIDGSKNSGNITVEDLTKEIIVGGLVGESSATINNCTSDSTINVGTNTEISYIGGLIGKTTGISETCTSKGSINVDQSSTTAYIGGLVGYSEGAMSDGKNDMKITYQGTSSTSNPSYVGGIVGRIVGSSLELTGCVNSGEISELGTTGNINVGGIVGACEVYIHGSLNNGDIITYCDEGKVGGIVGFSTNHGGIENASNAATVTTYANKDAVGGVVGLVDSGSIRGCSNTGLIDGSNGGGLLNECLNISGIGGICGVASGEGTTVVDNVNSGQIKTGTINGGIVGQLYNGASVDKGYNTGDINGPNLKDSSRSIILGGVVGQISETGEIINSYNEGTIQANDSSLAVAGGVLGRPVNTSGISSSIKVSNDYNIGNIGSGQEFASGGVVGISGGSTGLTIENTYNSGNVKGYTYKGAIIAYCTSTASIKYSYYLKTDSINNGLYAKSTSVSATNGYFTGNDLNGSMKITLETGSSDVVDSGETNCLTALNKWKNEIKNDTSETDFKYDMWRVDDAKIQNQGYPYFERKVDYDTSWYYEADGSESNPYIISDYYDMRGFEMIVNGRLPYKTDENNNIIIFGVTKIGIDNFEGKTLTQNKDIIFNKDLLNESYSLNDPSKSYENVTSIGTSTTTPFKGTYNGQDYYIKGVYIKNNELEYAGLFGNNAGVIKNTNISDSYIEARSHMGSLVGKNMTGGIIENCSGEGNVTSSSYSCVGGLIGTNNGLVNKCHVAGKVIASSSNVGGLIGENNAGQVINSYSEVNIVNNGEYTGGLVGYSSNNSLIENCYSTGSVAGSSVSYQGGITSVNNNSTIKNCYNSGKVNVSNGSHPSGGIAGYNYNGNVENCYFYKVSGYNGSLTSVGRGSSVGCGTFKDTWENSQVTLDTINNTDYITNGETLLYKGLSSYASKDENLLSWTIMRNINDENPVFGYTPDVEIKNAKIRKGKNFISNFGNATTSITLRSSLTSSFDVTYSSEEDVDEDFKVDMNLPANTKIYLSKKDSQSGVTKFYYYRVVAPIAPNASIPLTSFRAMGSNDYYTKTSASESSKTYNLRLVFDFGDVTTALPTGEKELNYRAGLTSEKLNFTIVGNNTYSLSNPVVNDHNVNLTYAYPSSANEGNDSTIATRSRVMMFRLLDPNGKPCKFSITSNNKTFTQNGEYVGCSVANLDSDGNKKMDFDIIIEDEINGNYTLESKLCMSYDNGANLNSALDNVVSSNSSTITVNKSVYGLNATTGNRIIKLNGSTTNVTYNLDTLNLSGGDYHLSVYRGEGHGQFSSVESINWSMSVSDNKANISIPNSALVGTKTTYKLVFSYQINSETVVASTCYVILK